MVVKIMVPFWGPLNIRTIILTTTHIGNGAPVEGTTGFLIFNRVPFKEFGVKDGRFRVVV